MFRTNRTSHNATPQSYIRLDLQDIVPLDDGEADAMARHLPDGTNLDALPAPVRNFIRLQHEITGRDVGEKSFMLNPPIMTSLTQDNSKIAAAIKAKKHRQQIWDEYMLYLIQFYNRIYARVYYNIEVKLETLDLLTQNLHQMHDYGLDANTDKIEQRIDTYREKLLERQKRLQSGAPPSRGTLKAMNRTIDKDMDRLARGFTRFIDTQIQAALNIADSKIAKFTESLDVNAPKTRSPMPFAKAANPPIPDIRLPNWDALAHSRYNTGQMRHAANAKGTPSQDAEERSPEAA